jgi:hypothetical protein
MYIQILSDKEDIWRNESNSFVGFLQLSFS